MMRLPDRIAVLDFETTAPPTGFRPVEVGVVHIVGGGIADEFHSVVNPGCPVDQWSRRCHGIRDAEAALAPPFAEVWDRMLGFLDGGIVVAHNARFEALVLRNEIERLGLKTPNVQWWCTLRLARGLLPGIGGYGLDALLERLSIACPIRHRAGPDSLAAAKLLLALSSLAEARGWDAEQLLKNVVFLDSACWPPKGCSSPTTDKSDTPPPLAPPLPVEKRTDRAIDDLFCLCRSVTADGILTCDEAVAIQSWLEKQGDALNTWPASAIYPRLKEMLSDGILDAEEQVELLGILQKFSGTPDDEYAKNSTRLPFSDPEPEIAWDGTGFVFTGEFVSARRSDLEKLVPHFGGALQKSVTKKTSFLVVGEMASREWAHATFGRKIARAMELRTSGHPIAIVSEKHWMQAVNERQQR
jgi:DNA polymerase III epsilon subunit-like protein